MKSFSKLGSALAVLLLFAGTAIASDSLAAGKIKGVNADKSEFILTDTVGKDITFTLSDTVVVNRGGNESSSDLKAGDPVNVSYNKTMTANTAKYILIQEDKSKNWSLTQGSFKNYDASKKEIIFTDAQGKDITYAVGYAKILVNQKKTTIDDIKIGEPILCIIMHTAGDKVILQALRVERIKK